MSTQSNNSLVTYRDVKSMIKNSFRFNETTESVQLTINEDGQVSSGSKLISNNIDIDDFSMMFFSEINDISSEQSYPSEYFTGKPLYTQTHVIAPIILLSPTNKMIFTFTEIAGPYNTTNISIVRTDSFVLNTKVLLNKQSTNKYSLRFTYSVSREKGFSDGAIIKIVPRVQFFQ